MLTGAVMVAEAEAFTAAQEREAALAKELGTLKAENAELHTKLQKVTQSLKNSKVTAREALIEMADQNAKLVQAFVDKKRECKQLKASAKEDRKAWQQRLQTMETELQQNKQHIQQLMHQLQALAAPLHPPCQAAPGAPASISSKALQQHHSTTHSSSSSSTSCSIQQPGKVEAGEGAVHSKQTTLMQPAKESCATSQPSPLADATNRMLESTRKIGAAAYSSSPEQDVQDVTAVHNQKQQRSSNRCGAVQAGLSMHASVLQQQQQQQQHQQCHEIQKQQQGQHSKQVVETQRQVQQLQEHAKRLQLENAALKSAQAAAAAQIHSLKLLQQAEQLKQQGNRCFQAQEYLQAIEAYTQALALEVSDHSLTAVLLCNRAAAQHAEGRYLDAISDCCMAHQLDPLYPRALQRRAEAYQAVQHYGAAVADLQKLLENSAVSSSKEVAARLASAQARQRVHGSVGPNHYLILGLTEAASAADIKAAYKRLALKHHPDKAVGPEAKAAAESVFVLITTANSVLSDPHKRAVYDAACARSSLLHGGHFNSRSAHSHSSGRQRHSSSTGVSTASYVWQQSASGGVSAHQAASAAANRAAAEAAAAAASLRRPSHWQPGFHTASSTGGGGGNSTAPASSCSSTHSCASGTNYPGQSSNGMRV